MSSPYEGMPKVLYVIDDFRFAINRGEEDGVKLGDRFLIFQLGPELEDPDTGEKLGRIEIVRGKSRVTHVQPKLSTLRSDEHKLRPGSKKLIRGTSALSILAGQLEEVQEDPERIDLPIDVEKGDLAKKI